jgi:UDP-N-acetylmuramoyl-tripeptide--D-alanyl-D-alanine ligase
MMTLQQAAQLAVGTLVGGDAQARLARVVTDSRAVQPGDLFVALKGERFDAHDFVADVLARGAVAALVAEDFALENASLIRVDDTRLALGRLAAGWAAAAACGARGHYRLQRQDHGQGNADRHSQGPCRRAGGACHRWQLQQRHRPAADLAGADAAHRYAVLEMGMNHHGELTYLTGLARPQVALVNNAMRAHFGYFADTTDVARAKAEIFLGLPEDGVAIVNADDANVALFRSAAGQHRVCSFGLQQSADITARDITCRRWIAVLPCAARKASRPSACRPRANTMCAMRWPLRPWPGAGRAAGRYCCRSGGVRQCQGPPATENRPSRRRGD